MIFNVLYEFSHRTNPPSIPKRVQDNIVGATGSVKGVFTDFLTPILLNSDREPTRKGLIDLHRFISGNAASLVSNLGGVRIRYIALMMTADDYRAHTGFVFVPPYKPGNYPQSMGNAQE